MIKSFSVTNFKNFKEKVTLDFSREKENKLHENLMNKIMIYGPSNSGKSNFGAAIMDITTHLTDFVKDHSLYTYYLNGDATDNTVEFEYEFLIQNKNIKYSYKKDSTRKLLLEELREEGNLLFRYNYITNQFDNHIEEAQTIDISKRNNTEMSVLKIIYVNTLYWKEDSAVKLLMEFVSHMLWFKFMDLITYEDDLNDFIINNKLLSLFEKFLHGCGQNDHLCEIYKNGKKVIGVKYKNYEAVFSMVASTGTKALWLLFCLLNRTKSISFLYLDDFDVFDQNKVSAYLLNYMNQREEFQTVFISHHINLMLPNSDVILKKDFKNKIQKET